jgi:hypothetical protein
LQNFCRATEMQLQKKTEAVVSLITVSSLRSPWGKRVPRKWKHGAAAHLRVSDSGEVCGQTKYSGATVVVTKAVSHPQTTLQLLWQRGSEFQQSAVTYAFYRVNDPSSVESWYPGFARHSHHRVRSVALVQRAPHRTVQLVLNKSVALTNGRVESQLNYNKYGYVMFRSCRTQSGRIEGMIIVLSGTF